MNRAALTLEQGWKTFVGDGNLHQAIVKELGDCFTTWAAFEASICDDETHVDTKDLDQDWSSV